MSTEHDYLRRELEAERLLDDAQATMLNGDPSGARSIARRAIDVMDKMVQLERELDAMDAA